MKLSNFLTTTAFVTTATALSFSFLGVEAQAANLIGNIDGVPTSVNFSTTTIDAGIGQAKAVEFTTPATPAFPLFLKSFEMYLAGYDTVDVPVIEIFQGTTDNPVGGTTVTLSGPNPAPLPDSDPNVGINNVYSYQAFSPSPYEFVANTTYTLQVSATNGAFNWLRDSQDNVTPTGIATFSDYLFRQDFNSSFGPDSTLYNNFAITVEDQQQPTGTPEPATMLGLLAVGAIGFASRRRQK